MTSIKFSLQNVFRLVWCKVNFDWLSERLVLIGLKKSLSWQWILGCDHESSQFHDHESYISTVYLIHSAFHGFQIEDKYSKWCFHFSWPWIYKIHDYEIQCKENQYPKYLSWQCFYFMAMNFTSFMTINLTVTKSHGHDIFWWLQ